MTSSRLSRAKVRTPSLSRRTLSLALINAVTAAGLAAFAAPGAALADGCQLYSANGYLSGWPELIGPRIEVTSDAASHSTGLLADCE